MVPQRISEISVHHESADNEIWEHLEHKRITPGSKEGFNFLNEINAKLNFASFEIFEKPLKIQTIHLCGLGRNHSQTLPNLSENCCDHETPNN